MEAKYCVYLPDPFINRSGKRIENREEWEEQVALFRELTQKYMYGKWPGAAQRLKAEIIMSQPEYGGRAHRERINLLINDRYPLEMEWIYPTEAEDFPVIVNNASCRKESRSPVEEKVVVEAGYGIATFEREMIMPDHVINWEKKQKYPELSCGTIMAWGWCQSIVADYLKSRKEVGELIATGHSRCGKAALCAGIFDDRFAVVAPMGSGCGGAGSARFLGTADGRRQDEAHCETIGALVKNFPHWFSEAYGEFGTKQEPYPLGDEVNYFSLDAHILRAACAPRAVFCSEGTDDFWANGFGTQLAYEAAQKVFDFLEVPEKNGFHVRPGGHAFNEHDWLSLIDFCDLVLGRERKMMHDDTGTKFFDIKLADYAPWA